MADEDKHQLIRSLKREFDAKQAQLRNVREFSCNVCTLFGLAAA